MSIIAANKTSHTVTTEYYVKVDVLKKMVTDDLGVDPSTVELIWDIYDSSGYDDRYSCSSPTLRGLKIKVITK